MIALAGMGARAGWWGRAWIVTWLSIFAGWPTAAQQPGGVLAGTVVDELTLVRLEGVTVSVLGTDLRTVTDDFGQFLLAGVPAGEVSVRIALDGYVSVVERLEASAADFLQVRLRPMAAALDEILVVAGRRRDMEEAREIVPGADLSKTALDILQEDVPGVVVRRGGGDLGTGAAVFIRGAGSFRDNAPQIFVDGVRVDDAADQSRALNVLDLIPAEEVARIRVFRGPSAAAAFALGANGIILIETLRGGDPGTIR